MKCEKNAWLELGILDLKCMHKYIMLAIMYSILSQGLMSVNRRIGLFYFNPNFRSMSLNLSGFLETSHLLEFEVV